MPHRLPYRYQVSYIYYRTVPILSLHMHWLLLLSGLYLLQSLQAHVRHSLQSDLHRIWFPHGNSNNLNAS